MSAPGISAAVITLNEERMLPGLLDSIAWVDEIAIVDGGSRDATVAIARERGCLVEQIPFDSYAKQRNRAIDRTTREWVFSIDADERPAPALVRELRERLAQPRHEAYRVPIRSRIFGRPFRFAGTQDDRPVRLFRRDAARWTGDVHETLAVDGRIGRVEGWLEHETLPDLTAFLAKMNRYTSLEASQRVAAGRKPQPRDAWLSPSVEVFRRLLWKQGCLDGPEGWAFCLLSGLSAWVLARKHRQLWQGLPT